MYRSWSDGTDVWAALALYILHVASSVVCYEAIMLLSRLLISLLAALLFKDNVLASYMVAKFVASTSHYKKSTQIKMKCAFHLSCFLLFYDDV